MAETRSADHLPPPNDDDPLRTTDHDPSAPPGRDVTPDAAPTSSVLDGDTGPYLAGAAAGSREAEPERAAASVSVPGYEIEGTLGRGGMGVVYKARHLALKRTVALKMVLAGGHAGPAELARFRIEAEAAARLQHPNIVQIHEVGEAGGHPYCALEFVEGGSLASKLKNKPLPAREAAQLVEALARAMQLAHSRNVVHRDLKPANVLLAADGTPKITDFGLARQLDTDSGETQAGQVMGTPSYMAPEQASGRSHDAGPAADVYALGAIVYECLSGRPPFKGRTVVETLDRVRTQEPVPPSRLQPGVPLDLETICLKCLRKQPEKRYASAAELADDLARWLKGEPILARPVGVGERVRKWVRRRPMVAALLGLVFLVSAAGLGGIAWAYGEALAQAEQARKAEARALDEKEAADNAKDDALEKKNAAERLLVNSQVMLAEAAWRDGQIGLARDRLDEVPADLRRWEWRYLKRASSGGIFTLYGHNGAVSSVAYSPDGARLASAGGDGTVKVWDARTGQELLTIPTDGVYSVAFSPDGARLASGVGKVDKPGAVKLWDARTGRELRTLTGHTNGVSSVAFSPDGARLASASADNTVKVWDARTGQELRTIKGHTAAVFSVAFSPDGTCLASASFDGTVKVWDARTGQEIHTLKGHTSFVLSVAYSPDGTRLASGAGQLDLPGEVKLWDARTGQELRTLKGHTAAVFSVAFSPDGARLASGSIDRTVKLWDARTGQEISTLKAHTEQVSSVAFSPDGARLASGSHDRTVKLWDARNDQEIHTLRGHTGFVQGVAFSPDGTRLASGSAGVQRAGIPSRGEVKVWDARTGQELLSLKGHTSPVLSVAFSPDGARLASGAGQIGMPGEVKLWDARTGQELHTLKGHAGWVSGVAFSPDGARLASASYDQTVKVWDARTGQEIRTLKGHTEQVSGVTFSPDGARLASASYDQTVKVWDARTGQELFTIPSSAVNSVPFSPDGARLASGSGDTVKVWDERTGQELRTLKGHTSVVFSVAFSRDGTRLASASGDGTVKVWDAHTGQELFTLKGHTDWVSGVAFSPDGARLASGSGDRTVKLWDARADQGLRILKGHSGSVRSVAFSPGGARLASGSSDQTVKLWDARTGQELRTLKGHAGWVSGVAFSPDGARLASASHDRTVKLWDARTGQELFTLKGHTDPVRSVAFSPDGQRVVSRDNIDETIVWDVTNGQRLTEPVPKTLVGGSARSPDGRLFAWMDRNLVRLLGPPDAEELLVRRGQTRFDAAWHKDEAARCEKERQWQSAAFHLEHALRAQPGDGDLARRLTAALAQAAASDRALPNAATWRRLALAHLHAGQVDAYRRTAQQMQKRFAVPGEAKQAAFLLAGVPGFGMAAHRLALTDSAFGCGLFEWRQTIRSAVVQPGVLKNPETWLARLPKDDKLLRGAVLCRAGQHAEAVAELSGVRDPVGLLFRALAEHGRGSKEAARAALAEAKKLIPPDKIDLIEQTPLPWLGMVETRVLLRELETLLSRN